MDGPGAQIAGWVRRFAETVRGHAQILSIHCGHVHRSFSTSFEGIPLSVTPATAPIVALDLNPIDPDRPDGRVLITDEPPGYALHRWDGHTLVSHYEYVGEWRTLAVYNEALQPMIRGMAAEVSRPGLRALDQQHRRQREEQPHRSDVAGGGEEDARGRRRIGAEPLQRQRDDRARRCLRPCSSPPSRPARPGRAPAGSASPCCIA